MMEINKDSKRVADDAKDYENLLRDKIRKLRYEIKVLENQRRRFFSDEIVEKLIGALQNKNQKLETEAKSLNTKLEEFTNEIKRLELVEKIEKEKFVLAKEKEDYFPNLLRSLSSSYEEWKAKRALCRQPIELFNSWRGIVNDEPEVSWTIDDFSYQRVQERQIVVSKRDLSCNVHVKVKPILSQKHAIPCFQLVVQFEDDIDDDWKGKPMVILETIGKSQLGTEKRDAYRLDVVRASDGGKYHYGGTLDEPVSQLHCASLTFDLYFELPWSTREVQSEDGVLLWTVEHLCQVFKFDNAVLYSPYFLTAKDGFRMQAVLYVSTGDSLNLLVVRRCKYVPDEKISDYVVSVNILKPDPRIEKITFSRSADLKDGENFVVGTAKEFRTDTFLCKIKIAGQEC